MLERMTFDGVDQTAVREPSGGCAVCSLRQMCYDHEEMEFLCTGAGVDHFVEQRKETEGGNEP